MQPVRDFKQWTKTSSTIVMPLAYKALPGRHKKRKIRDKDEPQKSSKKMIKMSQSRKKNALQRMWRNWT